MADDKQQIRDLIDNWTRASAAGDISRILSLMDEDAVFLRAEQPPMRGREAFAAQFQKAIEQVRIEAASDIQEIEVSGDMAYCWNELSVTMTPLKWCAHATRWPCANDLPKESRRKVGPQPRRKPAGIRV